MNGNPREIQTFVKQKIEALARSRNVGAVRATLANLRRGVGKAPGSVPQLWPVTLDGFPQSLMGKGGFASKGEWAAHTALTLFALHQQGKDPASECVSKEGANLGEAVRRLSTGAQVEERVKRRFDAAITAGDPIEFAQHLRGLVQLLKQAGLKLDYPALGEQLYWFQYPEHREAVRLQWGRAFYKWQGDTGTEYELAEQGKEAENNETK